jgi:hypothetical protein
MISNRHQWGSPNRPSKKLTIRICQKCQMRKLSHHDIDEHGKEYHWTEFTTADGRQIANDGHVPPCPGVFRPTFVPPVSLI